MRTVWTLFRREMMGYFFSPIACIVMVCMLVMMGLDFATIAKILNREPSEFGVVQWFFNIFFNWITIIIMVPIITMRLFADEKKTGTIEALMTAPVRDWEYVLAKFAAGLFFYMLLWIPAILDLFVLRNIAQDNTPLEWGLLAGGYLGILLTGMMLIAMGCMASACTRNQIIAAVVAFAMGCAFLIGGFYFYINAADAARNFFEYFSMVEHMQELSRGVLEWKRLVFYLSGTFFFLFVTHRVVQARQWKT